MPNQILLGPTSDWNKQNVWTRYRVCFKRMAFEARCWKMLMLELSLCQSCPSYGKQRNKKRFKYVLTAKMLLRYSFET